VRRFLAIRLLLAGLAVLFSANAVPAQIQQVGPVVMTVSDMQRSVAFYSGVLAFQKVSDTERSGRGIEDLYGVVGARVHVVGMTLGNESIELQEFENASERAVPADARSNDLSFQHIAIIVSDMDAAYRLLRQKRVEHVSSYPQTLPAWNQNAAGIKAFYFKDPDGHPLEILQFPPDKGEAKWHKPTDQVFLGIDHTAIVVSNTDRSLAFYRDLLGMRVAGESENYGDEQEHLNNVFGAHLRITSLRSPAGPGIELLEYISPRNGRAASHDAMPTDIEHHETVVRLQSLETLKQARSAQFTRISNRDAVTELPLHANRAKLLSDPDGHMLLAVAP
jgi:catechol 2,3-dioxygenase-like lactoylglutathione lyase family enzyme